MDKIYREYCTGCGLCCSCKFTSFACDQKGFPYPQNVSDEMKAFCDQVCPMGPKGVSMPVKGVWGNYLELYAGHSSDKRIQKRASSGGVLTTLCSWLLERNRIDGVIQTTYNPEKPTESITVCSHTVDEIVDRCGSRYSISSPLRNIKNLIEPGKKYAFVGKPCDVVALRNYTNINEELKQSIVYMFSFFCAGTPSAKANEELLVRMGSKVDECQSLTYRGNGWPGLTTAVDKDGNKYTMKYETSWMEILGRDIRKSCKFCYDSIGEAADISCGDYWKINEEKKPDFSEGDGENCIFTWTEKGRLLLQEVCDSQDLEVEELQAEKMEYAQPNHYARRSTMLGKLIALWISGKAAPKYPLRVLIRSAKYAGVRKQLGYCKGTLLRIRKGTL